MIYVNPLAKFRCGRERVLFKNCDNRHRRPEERGWMRRSAGLAHRWGRDGGKGGGRKISGTIRKPTLSSPFACMMCPASHPGWD